MFEHIFLRSKWRRSIGGETIGTAFLCMTVVVASAILQDPKFIALTIAAQMVGYTFVGAGFLNPAVAAGVTLIRIRRRSAKIGAARMALIQLASFVATECAAAFAGAALGYALLGTDAQRQSFPAPEPFVGNDAHLPRAMLAEFIFTFQITYVMMNTCVAKEFDRVNVNRFLGPSIGCVLFVGIMIAGPISGAAMNPAIATALQLFQCIIQVGASANGSCRPLTYLWMYWIFEVLGGVCAGVCFLLFSNEADPSEFDEFVEDLRPESKDDPLHTQHDDAAAVGFGPRSTERDSLCRRRTQTLTCVRPATAGMHTLLDLDL